MLMSCWFMWRAGWSGLMIFRENNTDSVFDGLEVQRQFDAHDCVYL